MMDHFTRGFSDELSKLAAETPYTKQNKLVGRAPDVVRQTGLAMTNAANRSRASIRKQQRFPDNYLKTVFNHSDATRSANRSMSNPNISERTRSKRVRETRRALDYTDKNQGLK